MTWSHGSRTRSRSSATEFILSCLHLQWSHISSLPNLNDRFAQEHHVFADLVDVQVVQCKPFLLFASTGARAEMDLRCDPKSAGNVTREAPGLSPSK